MEIGIYDPEHKKFLASSMNSHFRVPGSGTAVKLEHAYLNFRLTDEHLNRPHYVFFRALNFTESATEGQKEDSGCLSMYIEAEFRADEPPCFRDQSLEPNSQIIKLDARTTSGSW